MSEAPTTNTTPSASSPAAVEGGAPSTAAAPSLADSLGLGADESPSAAASGEPATPASAEAGEGASGDAEAPTPSPASDNTDTPPPIDPASYEFTFPEGFTVDDTVLTDARSVFAELGIPKDKAQSLADLFVKAQEGAQAAATAAFETQQAANLETLNSMPEFQGPTREKSLQAIGRVLDEYGPDAKAGILSNPAVGNDPALARFILKMAQALSEGEPASPGRPAPNGRDGRSLANRTLAERLGFTDNPQ